MNRSISNSSTASLINFLIDEYYDGEIDLMVKRVGYSKQQVEYWSRNERKPQKATLRWLLSATIAPEFKVACEFSPVNLATKSSISKELARVLGKHKSNSGIYAFYDSMCNVIYVGKASASFRAEMYQQLRATLDIVFPKAVRHSPKERWEAVGFVSAYEIPSVEHLDYPKHVEALVLRLSKPVGNKVLGRLSISIPPKER